MQLLGQTVNGYKFTSFIDAGGFGEVYKTEKDGVIYAVKIFREAYVLREYRKKGDENRLDREIEIMKSTSHPNLVRYVDSFVDEHEDNKNYYLVMEFIEGRTLRKILEDDGAMAEDVAMDIFKKVSDGIDYLHKCRGEGEDVGIIHRDLKPENIIVATNGDVKIVDFGISKVIDYTSLTSTGEVIGTWPYMSPEQITDSKHIEKRSDYYTLGVILYEMLTDTLPYDFQTLAELIDKIKGEPPIPPRRRLIAVSNKAENTILQLLEKNPYQRFSDMASVVISLEQGIEAATRDYDLTPRFVLRLYDDKTVLEEYTKHDPTFGEVIFPANLQEHQKGVKKIIQENPNITVIIDPMTLRFAYDTYTDVKGLKALPYAPKSLEVITPDYLKDYKVQKGYVKLVIDEQVKLKADILQTPFHYTHNSTTIYTPSSNPAAEWFDLDCKLIKESIDYKNSIPQLRDTHLYAGICIHADSLKDARNRKHFLNTFSSFDCDGFMIYVDCIDHDTSEIVLYQYIKVLQDLQKYTGKPVIACRVNSIGLGLLCAGVAGFSCGTARFERFSEELYKDAGDVYNMGDRYYFPELLSCVYIKRATPTKFDAITQRVGDCTCHFCDGKSAPDRIKSQNTKLHFLEGVHKEVETIKSISSAERIPYFIRRIDEALYNYENLPDVFKPEEYQYIRRWKIVFEKLLSEQ